MSRTFADRTEAGQRLARALHVEHEPDEQDHGQRGDEAAHVHEARRDAEVAARCVRSHHLEGDHGGGPAEGDDQHEREQQPERRGGPPEQRQHPHGHDQEGPGGRG